MKKEDKYFDDFGMPNNPKLMKESDKLNLKGGNYGKD
jgi:hypothetical protein